MFEKLTDIRGLYSPSILR